MKIAATGWQALNAVLFRSGNLTALSQLSVVAEAMRAIADIPQEDLSPRDRALREAAQAIAEQVLNPPAQASLGQAIPVKLNDTDDAGTPAALPGNEVAGPAASGEASPDGRAVEIDPEFQTFVDSGRSKLSAIDDLLKEEDP